ncbi:histidine acid phosphatase [Grosmannia clavigera kw1407]|uniref:Histidine acid phosphatase n=1 Tax=Grosmannia clavigera (strain kw1407 / UAMH 11150) TaxID=655863 RepID=F0XEE0_GROCL|nr:histidine acid phosphatase [Grosmannia clavigera kw1407]EFX04235.1 histidine acid phosphatase [Grosmannia clavigera kw1407]
MAAPSESPKSYFPLAGGAEDGWSNEHEATATCFCGSVQLVFPIKGPGLLATFVCNCSDCRKLTASMFASNFSVADDYLRHVRGREKLTAFGQSKTVESGGVMTNYFCSTCGTLMYRVGSKYPGMRILRIGTVDDFSLHETALRPQVEQYIKDRVDWFSGVDTARLVRTPWAPENLGAVQTSLIGMYAFDVVGGTAFARTMSISKHSGKTESCDGQ